LFKFIFKTEGKIQLFGVEITVDWAIPEPNLDEETMAKVSFNRFQKFSKLKTCHKMFLKSMTFQCLPLYMKVFCYSFETSTKVDIKSIDLYFICLKY
jgi:hypothetical protein